MMNSRIAQTQRPCSRMFKAPKRTAASGEENMLVSLIPDDWLGDYDCAKFDHPLTTTFPSGDGPMGDPAALSAGAAATAPEAGAPLAVGVADAELPVGEGFELVRVMVGALAMAALAWAGVMVVVLGGTELTLLVLFVASRLCKHISLTRTQDLQHQVLLLLSSCEVCVVLVFHCLVRPCLTS